MALCSSCPAPSVRFGFFVDFSDVRCDRRPQLAAGPVQASTNRVLLHVEHHRDLRRGELLGRSQVNTSFEGPTSLRQ